MDLENNFISAQQKVEQLPTRPSNDELLRLYGLYKQATQGDVHGQEPGGFDFKAAAKYRAWQDLKGTSGEEAKAKYVDLVNNLVEKYS